MRLKADLEGRGHEVWFNSERLKGGVDWQRYIEDGIEWAALGKFVLLVTPRSVRRPDGFCRKELARAYERHPTIIPVMVATDRPQNVKPAMTVISLTLGRVSLV